MIMVLSVINPKFWFQCPRCHICIEKNGGCNHMQCYNCKHDFCWMCLGDWKSHGSEYYECSRYKENPNIAHESVHAQAREALKKYLHYYERVCWFPSCNVKPVVKCYVAFHCGQAFGFTQYLVDIAYAYVLNLSVGRKVLVISVTPKYMVHEFQI